MIRRGINSEGPNNSSMSKRRQPDRSAKKAKADSKGSKKNKKEKTPKVSKTAVPEEIPLKKSKVENSALDQLKTVPFVLTRR